MTMNGWGERSWAPQRVFAFFSIFSEVCHLMDPTWVV